MLCCRMCENACLVFIADHTGVSVIYLRSYELLKYRKKSNEKRTIKLHLFGFQLT